MRLPSSLIIITICLAILGMSSCRTQRKAVSPVQAVTGQGSSADMPVDINKAFETLIDSYSDWKDVSMPLKLQLNAPVQLSASGTIKMTHDKAISISLKVFGFEVGSLYADNDTIVVYAKINGKYFAESLSRMKARYGFSLADIQALILGQAFIPGEGSLRPAVSSRFSVDAVGESIPGNDYLFSFEPKNLPEWLHWYFVAGGEGDRTPSLVALAVEPDGLSQINCIYDKPVACAAGIVASSLRLGTTFQGKNIDAQITLSPDRASWDDGLKLAPPKIAANAKRVSTDQIFKMLGGGK